ncbi:hypothetical protein ACOMHN_061075 [Nucella lapillus]
MGFSQHPAQGFMWWPGFIPDVPDTQAPSFSFSEAVDLLARHTPDAVATAQGDKTSYLSAAELALGSKPLSAPAPSLPKESSMVANSMRRVQLRVRGAESQAVSPGSVPDFPGAMACGKFLKPEKLPFSRKACIVHDLIPGTALALSQEDLLLLQEESRLQQRQAVLSERCLTEWEETARRGLEAVSVMDSFLGGLVSVLKDPDHTQFKLRHSPRRSFLHPIDGGGTEIFG